MGIPETEACGGEVAANRKIARKSRPEGGEGAVGAGEAIFPGHLLYHGVEAVDKGLTNLL